MTEKVRKTEYTTFMNGNISSIGHGISMVWNLFSLESRHGVLSGASTISLFRTQQLWPRMDPISDLTTGSSKGNKPFPLYQKWRHSYTTTTQNACQRECPTSRTKNRSQKATHFLTIERSYAARKQSCLPFRLLCRTAWASFYGTSPRTIGTITRDWVVLDTYDSFQFRPAIGIVGRWDVVHSLHLFDRVVVYYAMGFSVWAKQQRCGTFGQRKLFH